MTKFEKLSLEASAELAASMAAVLNDLSTKADIISQHLPNLTTYERHVLTEHGKRLAAHAHQLKDNEMTMRLIVQRNGG